MHQTMCQLARETGIHHSPTVYSIIHFQLKCLKKRHAQELTAVRQLCTLVRLAARVTR